VLHELILYMSRRVAGAEGDELARDVEKWIGGNLGRDYAWPGNYRELEQCVKNVLIRRDYRPAKSMPHDAVEVTADELRRGRLTADELLSRYCTIVYGETGSYEETSRRIGLDRRTVKAKVNRELLSRLKER